MKKLLYILLLFPILSFGQTRVKITQQETVELFPHTIDSGLGTEASPYINADSTAGIKTKIAVLKAGRGGAIKLSANRFNVDSVIKITSSGIRIQSVVAGYNADSNAVKQGINGTTLICKKGGFSISGIGYPIGRTGGVMLSSIYLYGTKALQSIGSSSGTVGVQLNSYIDQASLWNVNMGGFDYGIKSVNTSGGWVDFGYFDQVEVQGGRIGAYYDNAGAGNFGQHFIKCAFAETKEHNFYVTASSTNENFVFTGTAFYRGSWGAGVTNPSNVYFAGTRSRFDGCEFVAAGYNLNTGTHVVADGLILAGDYNTVSGSAFLDNVGGAGVPYGLRVSGNHNTISGCVFNNNFADIIITGNSNVVAGSSFANINITGNNNIVFAPSGAVVTDSGTGNTIVTDKMILKPTVSDASVANGFQLSPTLTPLANGTKLIGASIDPLFIGGIGTIGITTPGSSYTNGTYTSVPISSAVGSGALATVVVSGNAITSVTITTAGSGYRLGNVTTISSASIGGTGSGYVGYIVTLNYTGLEAIGFSIDGVYIGRGGGAGRQFGNIAIGAGALKKNTTGSSNIAIGDGSPMTNNTTGLQNVGIGSSALGGNTTGSNNSAFGTTALINNTTGTNNTGLGHSALANMQTGTNSTAVGYQSLYNDGGGENTAVGAFSLFSTNTGNHNVGIGRNAGYSITTGTYNTTMGWYTAIGITTGSKNTIIGSNTTGFSSSLSNNVVVADGDGNMRFVSDASGRIYLGAGSATYPTIPSVSRFTIDNSTTMGTIPWTRMTTTQRTAITAIEGLTIYDTDLHKLMIYDGTTWQAAW